MGLLISVLGALYLVAETCVIASYIPRGVLDRLRR